MEWIQGIEWGPSGVQLQTITSTCQEHLSSISEMKSLVAWRGKAIRARGKTSFSDWRKMNQAELVATAQALGFDYVRCQHTHYIFESGGKSYIVPAGVLLLAMFRPFHGIARFLFAPQGLDNLCMPHGNLKNPEVLFFGSPRSATGMQLHNAQGIVNSLSWMQSFPSGRQMWSSVLEFSKQGQLNLTLPKANIQYFCIGHELSLGPIYIREIRIRLLEAEELPFESFSNHSRLIEFERVLHKLHNPKSILRHPGDTSIPLRNNESKLTDAEWSELKYIVLYRIRENGNVRTRRVMDLILEKLSKGLIWSGVATDESERSMCIAYFARLKADGRWEKAISLLRELRKAV